MWNAPYHHPHRCNQSNKCKNHKCCRVFYLWIHKSNYIYYKCYLLYIVWVGCFLLFSWLCYFCKFIYLRCLKLCCPCLFTIVIILLLLQSLIFSYFLYRNISHHFNPKRSHGQSLISNYGLYIPISVPMSVFLSNFQFSTR